MTEQVLEKIYNSSFKLLKSLTPKLTYSILVKEAINLVDGDHGALILEEENTFNRVYSTFKPLYNIEPKKKGLPIWAYNSRTALLVQKNQIKKMNTKFEKLGITSLIFIPLIHEKKSFGALMVFNKGTKSFTKDHVKILEFYASMASLAIKKAQLDSKVQIEVLNKKLFMNMESTLEKIHKSSLKFLAPLTMEEVYKTIIDEAIKIVSAEYGSLLLRQDGKFQRVYSTLPVAKYLIPSKSGFTYTSFKEHKVLVKPSDKYKNTTIISKLGLKSSLFIPLSNRGKSVGVIILNSKKSEFTPEFLKIINLYGSLASLAIKKTQLYTEAKTALDSQNLFISMASHELKTPITTIHGYAQLLNRKLANSGRIESIWARDLVLEGTRLTTLVNELLDVNIIKHNQLQYNLQVCSVKEIIERTISNFQITHPDRILMVEDRLNKEDNMIIADFNKIIQVLDNLLENAEKYSEPETTIYLQISQKKNHFIIRVSDRGKGIAPEDISKVFDGFYRGKNIQKEGMGLGLFLAKNIILHHRSIIDIKSKLGKGTTVTIKIPRIEYE